MELKKIENKISEISAVADQFPGVVIIHNVRDQFGRVEYISERGVKSLGLSIEKIKNLGADYHKKFFNEEDAKDYVPKMYDLIQKNEEDEIFSFFQQVRPSDKHEWEWHLSSSKILLRDEDNLPLLSITFAVPIDPLHHVTHKVSRLLEENNFLRANIKHYSKLSDREREVMKNLATGLTAVKIAEKLHITTETVKTHRKNIYQKLNIKSSFELSEYARAFDLV
ncbi:helix-turn-helix transcriptional regulator [Sphingobacteriaceae bacterium]|nr:helix-turn-helix transcriptional regulator [Sphingobacteriaceae bacterium]